jgi:hypothetical protein
VKTRSLSFLAITAALVLSAAPARAIDSLSGTYEGKASCKGISGGDATKVKTGLTIRIVEGAGITMTAAFTGSMGGETLLGFHAEYTGKVDRAKLAAVSCGLSSGNVDGVSLEGDVVIKPGSEKGTVKGSLTVYVADGNVIDVCTFSVKRTSNIAPKLLGCPM